jgi:hypothetical protein
MLRHAGSRFRVPLQARTPGASSVETGVVLRRDHAARRFMASKVGIGGHGNGQMDSRHLCGSQFVAAIGLSAAEAAGRGLGTGFDFR